jgi:hypothetical protein
LLVGVAVVPGGAPVAAGLPPHANAIVPRSTATLYSS